LITNGENVTPAEKIFHPENQIVSPIAKTHSFSFCLRQIRRGGNRPVKGPGLQNPYIL
jgi:hypothetical protein